MKNKVQRFGKFLSGMVMPNIGALIAFGFLAALFIDTGWIPNKGFSSMVGPMLTYLIPVLIASTGGRMIGGDRGRVVGAIAVVGAIMSNTDITMLMAAMVMGPLAGYCIKKFDEAMEGHMPAGFEMLINNFSAGLMGMILAMLGYVIIGPVMSAILAVLSSGVNMLVNRGLLPLVSVFIEPAKVLFLNNAINHGVFTPIATAQVTETGKSIMYMLEPNPGPGLGVLLAYMFFCKDKATRDSAPGAVIIHLLGGIHEIYFPYILMNPFLLLAVIAGGASGVFCFTLFQAGLTSAASPGSFLAIMMMAERHSYLGICIGVIAAAAVTFVIALPLLKFMGRDTSLEEAQQKKDAMKRQAKGIKDEGETAAPGAEAASARAGAKIRKIAFACDAGMGSSAMGATVLKKKLTAAGLTGIEVIHTPVSSIPADVQIVVTHQELGERAAHSNPDARLVLITNFLAAPEYEGLVEDVKKQNS